MPPDVSIIVPSYNTAEATVQLIRSVHERTGAAFELIVVDDASSDGTAARVRAEWPRVGVLEQPRRSGFAAACNAGIRRATAPLILLLNSDIIVNDDAIDRMVAFMREARAGACGCRLIAPHGGPQPYSTSVPSLGQVVRAALGAQAPIDRQPSEPVEVECLQGSCMLIAREAIERAGLFDEDFFMYCEDIDWCLRARAAGLRLWYLPQIVMTHYRGLSTSADVWRLTYHYHRSLWRLYGKHFAAQHGPLGNSLAFCGLCARGVATMLANAFRRDKRPRW